MIFEDADFPWDVFDNGEDVVHDDRLEDLSVLTQDIVYESIPDNSGEVVVTLDTTRRRLLGYSR